MALIQKDFATLNADAVARLSSLGYTDANYQGTVLRSMVESVDLHIADLYSDMASNLGTQYLSQAATDSLEGLGLLVGVTARMGESDAALRARIAGAITGATGTNLSALVSALSNLSSVTNVVTVPYTQGIGTMAFYLVSSGSIVDAATVSAAASALALLGAAGAYNIVLTPTPLYVNLTATITTSTGVGTNVANLQTQAQAAINTYINGLTMGQALITAELDAVVLTSSGTNGTITDFDLLTISTTDANGNTVEQLLRNYTPQFDQQLLPGTISIT